MCADTTYLLRDRITTIEMHIEPEHLANNCLPDFTNPFDSNPQIPAPTSSPEQ